jgi:hypothetical protein
MMLLAHVAHACFHETLVGTQTGERSFLGGAASSKPPLLTDSTERVEEFFWKGGLLQFLVHTKTPISWRACPRPRRSAFAVRMNATAFVTKVEPAIRKQMAL